MSSNSKNVNKKNDAGDNELIDDDIALDMDEEIDNDELSSDEELDISDEASFPTYQKTKNIHKNLDNFLIALSTSPFKKVNLICILEYHSEKLIF